MAALVMGFKNFSLTLAVGGNLPLALLLFFYVALLLFWCAWTLMGCCWWFHYYDIMEINPLDGFEK
jgi:hypothetical protein